MWVKISADEGTLGSSGGGFTFSVGGHTIVSSR